MAPPNSRWGLMGQGVVGSWETTLWAHKNVLGWIKSGGWAAGFLTDTARALSIVSDPHPNYFAAYG